MVTKNRFANVSSYELTQLGTNQLRRFNSLYRPEDFASLNQVLQVWGNNPHLSFTNAILVYAQNKNVKGLRFKEDWEDNFNCSVVKNADPIRLFSKNTTEEYPRAYSITDVNSRVANNPKFKDELAKFDLKLDLTNHDDLKKICDNVGVDYSNYAEIITDKKEFFFAISKKLIVDRLTKIFDKYKDPNLSTFYNFITNDRNLDRLSNVVATVLSFRFDSNNNANNPAYTYIDNPIDLDQELIKREPLGLSFTNVTVRPLAFLVKHTTLDIENNILLLQEIKKYEQDRINSATNARSREYQNTSEREIISNGQSATLQSRKSGLSESNTVLSAENSSIRSTVNQVLSNSIERSALSRRQNAMSDSYEYARREQVHSQPISQARVDNDLGSRSFTATSNDGSNAGSNDDLTSGARELSSQSANTSTRDDAETISVLQGADSQTKTERESVSAGLHEPSGHDGAKSNQYDSSSESRRDSELNSSEYQSELNGERSRRDSTSVSSSVDHDRVQRSELRNHDDESLQSVRRGEDRRLFQGDSRQETTNHDQSNGSVVFGRNVANFNSPKTLRDLGSFFGVNNLKLEKLINKAKKENYDSNNEDLNARIDTLVHKSDRSKYLSYLSNLSSFLGSDLSNINVISTHNKEVYKQMLKDFVLKQDYSIFTDYDKYSKIALTTEVVQSNVQSELNFGFDDFANSNVQTVSDVVTDNAQIIDNFITSVLPATPSLLAHTEFNKHTHLQFNNQNNELNLLNVSPLNSTFDISIAADQTSFKFDSDHNLLYIPLDRWNKLINARSNFISNEQNKIACHELKITELKGDLFKVDYYFTKDQLSDDGSFVITKDHLNAKYIKDVILKAHLDTFSKQNPNVALSSENNIYYYELTQSNETSKLDDFIELSIYNAQQTPVINARLNVTLEPNQEILWLDNAHRDVYYNQQVEQQKEQQNLNVSESIESTTVEQTESEQVNTNVEQFSFNPAHTILLEGEYFNLAQQTSVNNRRAVHQYIPEINNIALVVPNTDSDDEVYYHNVETGDRVISISPALYDQTYYDLIDKYDRAQSIVNSVNPVNENTVGVFYKADHDDHIRYDDGRTSFNIMPAIDHRQENTYSEFTHAYYIERSHFDKLLTRYRNIEHLNLNNAPISSLREHELNHDEFTLNDLKDNHITEIKHDVLAACNGNLTFNQIKNIDNSFVYHRLNFELPIKVSDSVTNNEVVYLEDEHSLAISKENFDKLSIIDSIQDFVAKGVISDLNDFVQRADDDYSLSNFHRSLGDNHQLSYETNKSHCLISRDPNLLKSEVFRLDLDNQHNTVYLESSLYDALNSKIANYYLNKDNFDSSKPNLTLPYYSLNYSNNKGDYYGAGYPANSYSDLSRDLTYQFSDDLRYILQLFEYSGEPLSNFKYNNKTVKNFIKKISLKDRNTNEQIEFNLDVKFPKDFVFQSSDDYKKFVNSPEFSIKVDFPNNKPLIEYYSADLTQENEQEQYQVDNLAETYHFDIPKAAKSAYQQTSLCAQYKDKLKEPVISVCADVASVLDCNLSKLVEYVYAEIQSQTNSNNEIEQQRLESFQSLVDFRNYQVERSANEKAFVSSKLVNFANFISNHPEYIDTYVPYQIKSIDDFAQFSENFEISKSKANNLTSSNNKDDVVIDVTATEERSTNVESNNTNQELSADNTISTEDQENTVNNNVDIDSNSESEEATVTQNLDNVDVIEVNALEKENLQNYQLAEDPFERSYYYNSQRYNNNIEAYRVISRLDNEHRFELTQEEKDTLASYTGWGGIKPDYIQSQKEDLLNDDSLNLSNQDVSDMCTRTLDSYFTPTQVIDLIYKKLQEFGFKGGEILEPSCGSGKFIGRLPSELQENSKVTGVEIDPFTAKISSYLYPNANILNKGFQKTNAENFYDVAIGNVPYANITISDLNDPNISNLSIHNYFFLKAIKELRPYGIAAFLTSSFTLDSKNTDTRLKIAQKANFLGAVRLPNSVFSDSNTSVVSDLIFLQKREKELDLSEIDLTSEEFAWINTENVYAKDYDKAYNSLKDPTDNDVLRVNSYFVNNPEQVAGQMFITSSPTAKYEFTTAILNEESWEIEKSFNKQAVDAISKSLSNIRGLYVERDKVLDFINSTSNTFDLSIANNEDFIKAQNCTYFISKGQIYLKLNSTLPPELYKLPESKKARTEAFNSISALINLRDKFREVLNLQAQGASYDDISAAQQQLSTMYDNLVNTTNSTVSLKGSTSEKVRLCPIEYLVKKYKLGDDLSFNNTMQLDLGKLNDKNQNVYLGKNTVLFTKNILQPEKIITHVNSADDALILSISNKAKVDLDYMQSLLGVTDKEQIIKQLYKKIYRDPKKIKFDENHEMIPFTGYVTADEYLSGNIYERIDEAKALNKKYEFNYFDDQIKDLEAIIPTRLEAPEISVELGARWIKPEYYTQFLQETFSNSNFNYRTKVVFDDYNRSFIVENKNWSNGTDIYSTYGVHTGTASFDGFEIFEKAVNYKSPKVTYSEKNADGKRTTLVDHEATVAVQTKIDLLKMKFANWIFKDPERTEDLVNTYNRQFNAIVRREYNGDLFNFKGMNSEITLMPHQKNAIARTLLGGNSLLAHEVGAGKTYEMCASAMEKIRLGLAHKAVILSPKAVIGQFNQQFLKLYPNAKILCATQSDLTPKNRIKFLSKMMFGDYDCILMTHQQFQKIPMNKQYLQKYLEEQMEHAREAYNNAESGTLKAKQLERNLASLKERYNTMLADVQDNLDYSITFEELGIDALYVDEAHIYKNIYLFSNIDDVPTPNGSKIAEDLRMKCKYLNDKYDYKAVVFATGTPLSNSMIDMYVMQEFLNKNNMKKCGIYALDDFISQFCSVEKKIELDVTGRQFQMKGRLSSFRNIPEAMSLFSEVADIKTTDMMNLKLPTVHSEVITAEATEFQKAYIDSLVNRAKAIKNGNVNPKEDNFLKISSEGRLLGLDPRCIEPTALDESTTKVNLCADKILEIYEKTHKPQIVFCDMSTPHVKATKSPAKKSENDDDESNELLDDNSVSFGQEQSVELESNNDFCVYYDLKKKLIAGGIKESEIAIVHELSDKEKAATFDKVNNGTIKILMGSTQRLGTGVNVQKELVAAHHLDINWKPSDIEQRNGRIVRQGNNNKDVDVFYYVTKGTFDSFMYSTVDRKAKFIRQIMHGDKSIRKLELESNELSYKDIMMAGLGDSKVKEFMECKEKFDTLTMQKKFFESEFQKVSRNVKFTYPNEIKKNEQFINSCTPDIELTKKQKFDDPNLPFKITLNNNVVTDKKVFGEFLASQFKKLSPDDPTFVVGDYHGFKVGLQIDLARDKNGKLERIERIALIGTTGFNYTLQVAKVPAITISRLNTTILQIPKSVEFCQKTIDDLQTKLQGDQKYLENNQSFDKDDELIEVTQKLKQLEASLVEASQQSDGNSNTDVIENVEFEEINDVHKDTNQENEVNQENNETEIKSVIHR